MISVLAFAGTGCRLNSAARPIGLQPEITSVIIDPVTLKPIHPAEERPPDELERLDDLEHHPAEAEPEDDLDVEM